MPGASVFDPALPALPRVFDLEALSSRFAELWAPSGEQPLVVTQCKRVDTRYRPGSRCVAAYDLISKAPDGSHEQTFGVLDVHPSGATHRLFPNDPELPALVSASSVNGMRERLAALPPDVTRLGVIDECTITPV